MSASTLESKERIGGKDGDKVNEDNIELARDNGKGSVTVNKDKKKKIKSKNLEETKGIGESLQSCSADGEKTLLQKHDKKRIQNSATKHSDAEASNHSQIDEKEPTRKNRDKAFLKSMKVAERGYVSRLRPESTGEQPAVSQYQIRPGLEEKFKAHTVKEIIHSVLNDELGGKVYSEEEAKIWSQAIANAIRLKVKDMGFSRYKFVVQCVLGEEHGAGVKIGSRCLWDADTDNYASDTFLNETIFCMTAVYAIYFY